VAEKLRNRINEVRSLASQLRGWNALPAGCVIQIDMAKALITTPFPTPSEVAAHFGIRPARAAELKRRLLELHAQEADRRAKRTRRSRGQASSKSKKK